MSLTTRAFVAIAVMIGFYVLSLTVIAVLVWIPYAEWHYLDRLDLRIAAGCLIAAAVVFWSILPRRDKFEQPGPRIAREQHPRLFAELDNIAQRTAQSLPQEVYLIPDVNAWVSQRGGTMGFGSRRVMGLGVPLMRLLTVPQFRAVLAHEFGHYSGGDTALGPWIYKTRAAIVRTLTQLAKANSWAFFLFHWYGNFFLRVTLAISRAQEYAADRLGARVGGARAMIEGLKQVHIGGVAWGSYLRSEIHPMLAAGFSPPLSQGLYQYLQAGEIQKAVAEDLQTELVQGKADKFDSHPALPERIAALKALPEGEVDADTRPATDLLDQFELADMNLFLTEPGFKLKPIEWDQALEQVYMSGWRSQVSAHADALRGMTFVTLGRDLHSWELRNRLKARPGTLPSNEQRDQMARALAGSAISLALMHYGWQVSANIGEPVTFTLGNKSIIPFEVVRQIADDKLKPDQWQQQCNELGVAEYSVDAGIIVGQAVSAVN